MRLRSRTGGQGIISSQLHAVCHCVGVSLLGLSLLPLFCVFLSFPFLSKRLTSSIYPSFTLSASRSLFHFLLPLSLMRSNSPSLNLPAFYLPLFLVPLSPSMRLFLSLSLFAPPLQLCLSFSFLPLRFPFLSATLSLSCRHVLSLPFSFWLEPCLHSLLKCLLGVRH